MIMVGLQFLKNVTCFILHSGPFPGGIPIIPWKSRRNCEEKQRFGWCHPLQCPFRTGEDASDLSRKRAASDLGAQSTPSESENLMRELHLATEIPRPHFFPEKNRWSPAMLDHHGTRLPILVLKIMIFIPGLPNLRLVGGQITSSRKRTIRISPMSAPD